MKKSFLVMGLGLVILTGCDNTPPKFITESNVTVLENQTDALSITATDNSDEVTLTVRGADAAYFNTARGTPPVKIREAHATLVLTFKTPPNFEVKKTYTVTAVATDSFANTATQQITITIRDIPCADGDVVTHHGIDYCEVVSPHTQSVWLDRNLGAGQACTAFDDASCYGDFYQWGRNADGHEKSTSATTTERATQIDPVQSSVLGKFIMCDDQEACDHWTADGVDSTGSIRSAKWSQTDGSNVCPAGFRVPTLAELKAELLDAGSSEIQKDHTQKAGNDDDPRVNAYQTFLKLPSPGIRYPGGGNNRSGINGNELWGALWGTSSGHAWASYVSYSDEGASSSDLAAPNKGCSVRCIRD